MRPIAVDGLKWSVSASVNNGYDRTCTLQSDWENGGQETARDWWGADSLRKGRMKGHFRAKTSVIVTLSDSFKFIGAI